MNSRLLTTLALVFASIVVFSQAEETTTTEETGPWKYGGFAALNLNQVQFVNWAAGGESSFSSTAIGNAFLNYKNEKVSWETNFDASYGIIKQQGREMRKNEDKLELLSKFGREAGGKKLYYSALLNFKSQFSDGFDYPNDSVIVSKFAAPAYLLLSAGLDWKPTEYFSLYFSPATGKFTFVNDQGLANIGAYGVDPAVYDEGNRLITPGKKSRPEFGAYLNTRFQKDVLKNVNLMTKVDLFNNFTDRNKANRGNIDVNWETTLNMKINRYLTTSVIIYLIYDHDIDIPIDDNNDGITDRTGPRTQLKEVFGVGLSYKFNNEKPE